ncbi:sensor histidine kinase [Microbacterium sp.]|uniref:sensor histidine kinase n=1 Tax=Microbacterium sp. TaxID=51671 RepID=UPI003A89D1BB
MTRAAHDARVRRSAWRVGILVGIASAVVLTVGVTTLVAVLVRTSRPERGHRHEVGERDRVVVDLDESVWWIVVLGVVGVAVMGLIGWLAARWAVRPLVSALSMQRRFVADASHELRTPLTALSSRVQVLQRRQARGDPIDDTVENLRHDVAVMDAVLTDMLLAAEGTHSETPPGGADVTVCVRDAVGTVAPLADAGQVSVRVTGERDRRAALPPVTLTRLLTAMLDNAVQHAPAGTEVTVEVEPAGDVVEVRIADRGPGIDPADVERIFERFARSGESGRRRGFGLGLALVREAATRYGGSVTVAETSPSGSTFLLRLPAA